MAVDRTDVVDAVGIDRTTDEAVLTIADQLDWSDIPTHRSLLQEKLNRYLGFIESGELLRGFPAAKNREVRIDIVFKDEPPSKIVADLERAAGQVGAAGIALTWRHYGGIQANAQHLGTNTQPGSPYT